MKETISINAWVNRFDQGDFEGPGRMTQITAGWYDWFCLDKSLAAKTKKLGSMVKAIASSPRFNPETSYVWFKNNCALHGNGTKLYDDFRIADRATGDIIFTIIPKDPRSGMCEVWGRDNDFEGPIMATPKWADVVEWFAKTPQAV